MATCPLCAHEQVFGIECEVCGRELGDLSGLGPPPVVSQVVDGLEATVAERVGDVAVAPLAGLEGNLQAEVDVVVQAMPDLDLGRAPDLGDVPVVRIELSVDRAEAGPRVVLPLDRVTCRFCRTEQPLGASYCARCGLQLPKPEAAPVAASSARPSEKTRCRACGAPSWAGQRCTDCGQEVPFPDG